MLENTEGQSRETDKIEDTVKHNKNTTEYVMKYPGNTMRTV
jgi:hypothetical protein